MHSGKQILIEIMEIMQRYSCVDIDDQRLDCMKKDINALIAKHFGENYEQRTDEKAHHGTDDDQTDQGTENR